MIYVFIDESGDSGEISENGSTSDFTMAACICYGENIDYLNSEIKRLSIRLRKKEIKFSKLSQEDVVIVKGFFKKLQIEHIVIYSRKTINYHGDILLRGIFQELVSNIKITKKEKVKFFIDGSENAYYRKIYEPIIRKYFSHALLKFANSIKAPMIQVADFYAGHRRRLK